HRPAIRPPTKGLPTRPPRQRANGRGRENRSYDSPFSPALRTERGDLYKPATPVKGHGGGSFRAVAHVCAGSAVEAWKPANHERPAPQGTARLTSAGSPARVGASRRVLSEGK